MKANLRLVVHRAKSFRSTYPLEERIEDGNFGLSRSVDSFEPDRGNKFSTYATWWIDQAIQRGYADKHATIRLPVHLQEKLNKIRAAEARCITKLEKEFISAEEIAAELLRMAKEEAKKEGKKLDKSQVLTAAKIGKIWSQIAPVKKIIPLETKIGEEEDNELITLIPDPVSPNAEKEVAHYELSATVEKALSQLKPKEQEVLRLRMGIGLSQGYTLNEIAQLYGVTRERIRQIEAKALQRLRHPTRAHLWEGFSDEAMGKT